MYNAFFITAVIVAGAILMVYANSDFAPPGGTKRVVAQGQIRYFSQALELYKQDTRVFPTNEFGLQALRIQPPNAVGWAGPYILDEIPLDSWGRPYLYKYPGEHGDEPDIISLGADGQPGGEGDAADIVSWSNK